MNYTNLSQIRTLEELRDYLNSLQEVDYDTQYKSDTVNCSALPTFGKNPMKNTWDACSWDDDNYMWYNGNEWVIEPRCWICGEGICQCNNREEWFNETE